MSRQQVVIDWDWGASGIWTVLDPDEPFIATPGGRWGPFHGGQDRHRAWRGPLTGELIECLSAWNDEGDIFMGRHAHEHTDEERIAFWARGRDLAERVQEQLGDGYEVSCRTPDGFEE